jgi:formiminotetrahydrofolate cyclodeaminase
LADHDYLGLSVDDFLGRVAAATAAPGAGPVAATVVALAAGLASMAAGLSTRHLPEADALAREAVELQERVKPLAQRDAEAYAGVLAAQGRPADDPSRPDALRDALSAAADVPLEIAEVGSMVLEIASTLVGRGNPNLEGDAFTAGLMAQAGVRSACRLVALNLSDPDDPRRARAAELERALVDVSLVRARD